MNGGHHLQRNFENVLYTETRTSLTTIDLRRLMLLLTRVSPPKMLLQQLPIVKAGAALNNAKERTAEAAFNADFIAAKAIKFPTIIN